jgi:hypothetical protein
MTTVAFGDSNSMHITSGHLPDRPSWADDDKITSFAVEGSAFTFDVSQGNPRIETTVMRVLSAMPKMPTTLYISGGTNDLRQGVTPQAIETAIMSLSNSLHQTAPTTNVVWLDVFPAGPAATSGVNPTTRQTVNTWLTTNSGAKNLNGQTVRNCNANITDPATPGYLRPEFTYPDGGAIHLDSAAESIVALCAPG